MFYRLIILVFLIVGNAELFPYADIKADSSGTPFKDINTLTGAPFRIFLGNWPANHNSSINYTAEYSVKDVVYLKIIKDTLLVYPIMSGKTTVFVSAAESYGNILTDSFNVTVSLILDSGIKGQVVYDNDQKYPLPGISVNLFSNGIINRSTYTTSKGFYLFDLNEWGTFSVKASSSLSAVNPVNSTDALLAVKYFVDPVSFNLSELRRMAADVNSDGRINSTDALIIQRMFLNLTDSFPAGQWVFSSSTVIINGNTALVPEIEIRGILVGDVNGSYFQQ